METVRLVIWDLDETFWRGTLSEGGIEYLDAHHDLVIALARRGIVSAICSRNDHDQVEAIMRQSGLWDYFVFPDINWSAKGPRLEAMVEAIRLRPATILFIDDNPMNRAEAVHFVQGLQVADPSAIVGMLDDPRFEGRDDPGLTRLGHYKLLQHRASDMAIATDGRDFLRASDVRVFIDHQVDAHLDRAIELINRTNQLNFTKIRLPEDATTARQDLRELIARYDVQTALIRVEDRYGDYGYCGLYVHSKTVHADPELIHYCFSCRVLGMGVETWLYRKLGRPRIAVQGDVLSDLQAPAPPIDWIRWGGSSTASAPPAERASKGPRIFMRGGCELAPLAHYLGLLTGSIVEEFAFGRDAVPIRRDHSQMLRLAMAGVSEAEMAALNRLGYQPSDFETALLGKQQDVWILSFWSDASFPLFRHRDLGFRVPFHAADLAGGTQDFTQFDLDRLQPDLKRHWLASAIAEIQQNYVFDGLIDIDAFMTAAADVLDRLPADAHAFVLGLNERNLQSDGTLQYIARYGDLNRGLRTIVADTPNVTLLFIEDYIVDSGDRVALNPNHFSRKVYFRLYEDVRRRLARLACADPLVCAEPLAPRIASLSI